jgi:hypothetical protein
MRQLELSLGDGYEVDVLGEYRDMLVVTSRRGIGLPISLFLTASSMANIEQAALSRDPYSNGNEKRVVVI